MVIGMTTMLNATPFSEIRLTRQEGYSAVSSEVVIRPESVLVIKHFDAMQRSGDTIGVFASAADKRLFVGLWAILNKASQTTDLRPDSRVLTVTGTQANKTRQFIIPLYPPIQPWAREFENRTDSMESAALSHPVFGLNLTMKLLTTKGKQKVELTLENPGTRETHLPKASLIQLQVLRKPGSAGWPAGGPVWDSLSSIRIDKEINLPAGEKIVLGQAIALVPKGSWYYRALYKAKGQMVADSAYIRGEVYSNMDSIVVQKWTRDSKP